MSETMVDLVARAIGSKLADDPYSFESMCLDAARAAIAAMREPTDGMCDAGQDDDGNPRGMWKLMIDAALKEGGE